MRGLPIHSLEVGMDFFKPSSNFVYLVVAAAGF